MHSTDTSLIRLLLVDDQALVRTGFRLVLDAQPDMMVVAEAGDGREAVQIATSQTVDVVLMDIRMPGVDGIAATKELQQHPNPPRVLVLTTFGYDEYAVAAIRAGAAGFLVKDAKAEELLEAIRAVHAGDSVLKPSATAKLVYELAAQHPVAAEQSSDVAEPFGGREHPRLQELTPRELDVLEVIAEGLNNVEIAERLHVSGATVKTHVNKILMKTQLRDRVQLVLLAVETGLVVPGEQP